MNKIIPYLSLILFFLVLAERITVEAILIGLVVAYIALKINENKNDSYPLYSARLWPLWIKFILILIKEIIHANIHVAGIVLRKTMPLEPGIHLYRPSIIDERLIVVLSNSITLTPGTITIDFNDGVMTIHALTKGCFDGLASNPIEKILLDMEEKIYG